MMLARNDRKTVSLDSPSALRPLIVVKPDFRGNRDRCRESVGLNSSPRTSEKLVGVSETQGSLGILAPHQEFSGGIENAKVEVADGNGDNGSILKLWFDAGKRLWRGVSSSNEHQGR